MSNLGLERYLNAMNLQLARTSVGDRYVVEHMRERGYNVGGEQSGHLVLNDFSTTGDGLIAALQVLAVVAESGVKASEAAHLFEPMPQILKNVRFLPGAKPLENQEVATAIQAGEAKLGKNGRLLIRKSGTEPLIRVMGECDDEKLIKTVVGDIVKVIEKACAA
jgi:phosphoglucosamine mutase